MLNPTKRETEVKQLSIRWLTTNDIITREHIERRYYANGYKGFELIRSDGFHRGEGLYGIYRLYSKDGKLLYVGVSINIYERIKQYTSKQGEHFIMPPRNERRSFAPEGVESIRITVLGKRSDDELLNKKIKTHLEAIEKYFIKYFIPPLNKRSYQTRLLSEFKTEAEEAFRFLTEELQHGLQTKDEGA